MQGTLGRGARSRRAWTRFFSVVAATATLTACESERAGHGSTSAGSSATGGEAPATVKVQILAINDFHGNLEPPIGSGGKVLVGSSDPVGAGDAGVPTDGGAPTKLVEAGGAAYLGAHLEALRADNPNTILVGAGDLTGASPLVSALFHDEPTVLVMNEIGLDVT